MKKPKKHKVMPLPRGRELDHIEGWGGPCCDCGSCYRDWKWLTKEARRLKEREKMLTDIIAKKGRLIVFA